MLQLIVYYLIKNKTSNKLCQELKDPNSLVEVSTFDSENTIECLAYACIGTFVEKNSDDTRYTMHFANDRGTHLWIGNTTEADMNINSCKVHPPRSSKRVSLSQETERQRERKIYQLFTIL